MLTALTPLLGGYMARVFRGERVFLTPVLGPLERLTYRLLRVDPSAGRTGRPTPAASLVFSALFWLALYLILRTQGIHPFNPEGFHSGTWDVTFNTTSSFVTNTNWQYYGGETTLTYFSQMAGLAVQNFVSAAVGIAVRDRADPRHRRAQRRVARQLLAGPHPHAALRAAADLVRRRARPRLPGRDPDLSPYATFTRVAGGDQTLALGPVASQEASRSSAPTAAASSTSTPRCRSRTRAGSRTSSRCC